MKTMKIVACFAIVLAALAYAGLPPITVGGLVFKGVKSVGTMEETNGWIVIKGYDIKTTFQLDKTSPVPAGQNVVIEMGKALKASNKVGVGSFSNIIYGTFVEGAEGDITQLTLSDPVDQGGKKFDVKLKGVTIGTVISKGCAPQADSIKNAVLTELKPGKGVAVTASGKAPLGVLGGVTGDMGALGVTPELFGLGLGAQISMGSDRIGKATGKGSISELNIYTESIPEKKVGKPIAKLSTKIMQNVHVLEPGAGTNSSYKVGKGQTVTYDLTRP